MSPAAAKLRAEFEAEILADVARLGPEGFSRDRVIKAFSGRGTSQPTLYRWAAEIVRSGKPGQHVARIVKEAAQARAARTPEPAKEVAGEIATMLPVRIAMDDVVKSGGTLKVIDKLNEIVDDLDKLVAHAKTPEGGVRNARLLLGALREARGCVETGLRLYQAMREVGQVDRLQEAMLDEIAKLSPETAEAIYRRMDQIASQWAG